MKRISRSSVSVFIFLGLSMIACDQKDEIYLSAESGTYGAFTDRRDRKTYKTVTINDQTWMAENLAYIPYVSDGVTQSGIWIYDYEGSDTDSARSTENYQTYGCLYSWKTAMKACPEGWHLPTDEEWTELAGFIRKNGFPYSEGVALKASTGWMPDGGVDAFGFNARPAGSRGIDGAFYYVKGMTTYWSATEDDGKYAWAFRLDHTRPDMGHHSGNKLTGYSVRCIKDQPVRIED